MNDTALHEHFFRFLDASPTPFHAAQNLATLLNEKGFQPLREDQTWQLTPGSGYYYTRSDSTLVAFKLGRNAKPEEGVRLVGAHTDSPCLKVKPQPEKTQKSYQQVGIEVYGGALLNPWFDRDLSIAGKVCYLDKAQNLSTALINFEEPVAVIPSLAIHLDREANSKRTVNAQKDMSPILFQGEEKFSLRELLLQKLHQDGISDAQEVLDFDLSFYDVQGASLVGLKKEFFAGARLDNLLSSFVAVYALANADTDFTSIAICNDHEEIGSRTDIGAQGTSLEDLFQRLFTDNEARQIAIRRSLMISVDNAHGIHPNYIAKHDDNHGPILNRGPVLKFDANKNYATSSHSAAFVRQLAAKSPALPLQDFVMRSDMRCGSTIGPLTASGVGINAIDIGVPTFAMHSIRELGGRVDLEYLGDLLSRFYLCENVSL